jgi:hypothetical protein
VALFLSCARGARPFEADRRHAILDSRRVRYPWAMAPTINTTKLVATAIANLYLARSRSARPLPSRSGSCRIAHPSRSIRGATESGTLAATPMPPVFEFFLFLIASNFSALMDARRSVRRKSAEGAGDR